MTPKDSDAFTRLIADVHAFYRAPCSDFAIRVWWEAMKPYDLAAVQDAMNRHCVNPDTGQFLPKPADVVKMLGGTSQDAALTAWSEVDRAVRIVGNYRSVVFADPVIHRVLHDMGGWIQLGTKTNEEWPFLRNEFVNRYRGYRMRSEVPEYPPVLIGMTEAQNSKQGFGSEPPVLLGDPTKARRVLAGGSKKPILQITQMSDAGEHAARLLTNEA